VTGYERRLAKLLQSQADEEFAPGFWQRVMQRIDSAPGFYFELRQCFVRLSAAAALAFVAVGLANVRLAAEDATSVWPAALGMPNTDLATVVNVASGAADLT
jgi:hypothetical protein